LTFEEIGQELDISPQQVHKIEKEAFNKVFQGLLTLEKYNPVEIVSFICNYFGIQPDQFMKKLDKKNKEKLLTYISSEYEKYVPGITEAIRDRSYDCIEELIR
jgi:DNA-binding XRE family transcriptional regulator